MDNTMEPPQGSTNTDTTGNLWPISDLVIRLRQWATERSKLLPALRPGEELIIGSHPAAWLQVADENGRVSRKHCVVICENGKLIVRDAGSKNGIMVDGKLVAEVELDPGLEFLVGGVTLVAESSRLVALRTYLARLLGWTTDRVRTIDLALRSIRAATNRQAALVLCADHDPELIARALHRHVFGADRPFLMCDPGRKRVEENVRAAENYQLGMQAIAAAKHGTVCIWNNQLPKDFAEMKVALQDLDTRVLLVVCAYQPSEAEAFGVTPITIPALYRRAAELPRIIEEYAYEAAADLGLPRASFPREDLDWIIQHASTSLSEIEKATLRLLAIREAGGNMTAAATRLGMARSPLTRWVGRRKLPMRTSDE